MKGAMIGGLVYIVGLVIFTLLASMAVPAGTFLFGNLIWLVVHLGPLAPDANGVIIAMWVVPVVGLTYGGYYVSSRHGGGVKGGATLVAGYLPLSLLSFLYLYMKLSELSSALGGGGVPITDVLTPEVIGFLLFAGAVMPAVFGGIGGKLGE